jgi:hypothetical protein
MTTVELERIARSIIPPVGATMAIARVDEQLKHRAAFLVDGRIHGAPVGPAFDKPRQAIALVDLLNGEAPRPRLDDSSGPVSGLTRGDARVEPEAPGPQEASTSTCAGCGGPLPPGRHGQRRLTCSAACRQRLRYQRSAKRAGADIDGGTPNLTPSRPSEADDADPSSRAGGDTLRPQLGATDPTDLSNGPTGKPLLLGI